MTNTTVNTVRLETGIDHLTSTLLLGASPNPASSYVVFDFSGNALETGELSIYTITGKLWLTKTKISSSERINIGDLPSGIYICTITTKEDKFVVKVVKE